MSCRPKSALSAQYRLTRQFSAARLRYGWSTSPHDNSKNSVEHPCLVGTMSTVFLQTVLIDDFREAFLIIKALYGSLTLSLIVSTDA